MPPHSNTPTKYQQAQIYKISNTDTNDVYIGSTNYAHLSKRYWRHRRDGKDDRYKHRYGKIFETDNHKIECLQKFPCSNKEELRTRERYWIEQHDNAINCTRPIITNVEKKEICKKIQKDWYHTHNGKQKKKITNDRFRKNNPNYSKLQWLAKKEGLSIPEYRKLKESKEVIKNDNKNDNIKDILLSAPPDCKGINISIKFD